LCFHCYNLPGVREQHPSTSKFARRGAGTGNRNALPPTPTTAIPGSEAKVAILEARCQAGFALWHPADKLNPFGYLTTPRREPEEMGRHNGVGDARPPRTGRGQYHLLGSAYSRTVDYGVRQRGTRFIAAVTAYDPTRTYRSRQVYLGSHDTLEAARAAVAAYKARKEAAVET
jgi:hypothetical protein